MILVVGATGSLGGKITRKLLEQGRDVRVLVRPGSNYQALVDAGAHPAIGDLRNPASLDEACKGVDTVITTAMARMNEDPQTMAAINLNGYLSLIQTAKAAGVKHFIFTSALGAAPGHPVPFMAIKGEVEQAVRNSGIAYTILRPDSFADIWVMAVVGGPALQGQPVWIVGDGKARHTFVVEQNVADFAVATVDNPAALNQDIAIGGPDALGWNDVIEIWDACLLQPIAVEHAEPFQPIPGMPEFMVGLLGGLATTESVVDMSETAPKYGVDLISVKAFTERVVGDLPGFGTPVY